MLLLEDETIGLLRAEVAQGAVIGALDPGLMPCETVECFLKFVVVEQKLERAGPAVERILERRDAAELPGGGDELVAERDFDGRAGFDLKNVPLFEVFELSGVFAGGEQDIGAEAVGAGVGGRTRFAFAGARAGTVLRIGAVGLCAPRGGWVRFHKRSQDSGEVCGIEPV